MGAGPMIAAIGILLVGIIAIVLISKGGDKQDDPPEMEGVSTNNHNANKRSAFKEPEDPYQGRGPPPELSQDIWKRSRATMGRLQEMLKAVKRHQKAAVESKQGGDDEMWQSEMKDASTVYANMKDVWNELLSTLPANDKWDQEQLANEYLGMAQKPLADAAKVIAGADKIRR